MEEVTKYVNRVVNYMEKDNRGVHFGCYAVALTGLTVAIRRVRPFSKFKKPSDIPNQFLREKRELCGVVKGIDPNGGILLIQHKPLLPLPGIPDGKLPVKISGVNITGLGFPWLQGIVYGQEVKFVPIKRSKDYIECEVILPQEILDKRKKKKIVRNINVGESLVRIGFAKIDIDKPLRTDPDILPVYSKLQQAERDLLRQQMGLRYYIKPAKFLITLLAKRISNWIDTMLTEARVKVPGFVKA